MFTGEDGPERFDDPALEMQPEGAATRTRRTLWSRLFAWLLIGGVVVFSVLENRAANDERRKEEGAEQFWMLEFQGRYFVGMKTWLPAVQMPGEPDAELTAEIEGVLEVLDHGSIGQRLRCVVLRGEVSGASRALESLQDLASRIEANDEVETTAAEGALLAALDTLYGDYLREDWKAASLSQADRDLLVEELGWIGDLALAPEAGDEDARQEIVVAATITFVGVVLAILAFFGFGAIGLGGVIVLVLLVRQGRVRPAMVTAERRGGVYLETFAIWLLAFLVVGKLTMALGGDEYGLWIQIPVFFVSLGALAWARVRGVPWREIATDIGWTRGKRPLIEPGFGIAGYAMSLPFLAVGAVITFVLLQLGGGSPLGMLLAQAGGEFEPIQAPSHPAVEMLIEGSLTDRLVILFLACVAAPIVEETVFRGLLFRYLRESTSRLGRFRGWLVSALGSSFVFAAVHPQGLVAVPALMGLAVGFCLIREWRGSLVPCMVAHGINNFAVLALLLLVTA